MEKMLTISDPEGRAWYDAVMAKAASYRRTLAARSATKSASPALVSEGTKRGCVGADELPELKRRAVKLAAFQPSAPDPALALADVLEFKQALDDAAALADFRRVTNRLT